MKAHQTKSRRGLRKLGQNLDTLTRTAVKRRGFADIRILTDWPLIVGEILARTTAPLKITTSRDQRREGVLHICVAPGFATEVQHLEPIILEKVAVYCGYRAASRLRIIQAPLPEPPAPRHEKPSTDAPLPENTTSKLKESVGQVEEDSLRNALLSLGTAVYRKQKKLQEE